jgi:hypothetical protein
MEVMQITNSYFLLLGDDIAKKGGGESKNDERILTVCQSWLSSSVLPMPAAFWRTMRSGDAMDGRREESFFTAMPGYNAFQPR